jgi:hypothetical protein
MKTLALFTFASLFILAACTKNKGTITLTYNKATAVYGKIEEIRSTPLWGSSRNIDNPGKIFIDNDVLLIGEKRKGIHVFDNSNSFAPINVGFIELPFTEEFYVHNNMIYAVSHYDLVKIDISSISSPTLVHRLEYAFGNPIMNDKNETLLGFNFQETTETFELNSKEAKELERTNYLFFDYSNQMIPQANVPSSFAGNGTEVKGTLNKITVHQDYVYVIGHDRIYTFMDSPTTLVSQSTVMVGMNLETIYPQNNNLFIGTRFSMIVMGLSNPAMPNYISEYFHPTSCDPVYPYGNVAYLTLRTSDFSGCSGDENSLTVLDISTVSNPIKIDEITMISPYGMTLIDNHLFVGEGSNGLSIFDATTPDALVPVSYQSEVKAYDIIKHPTLADVILTTGDNGLTFYKLDYTSYQLQTMSMINY